MSIYLPKSVFWVQGKKQDLCLGSLYVKQTSKNKDLACYLFKSSVISWNFWRKNENYVVFSPEVERMRKVPVADNTEAVKQNKTS